MKMSPSRLLIARLAVPPPGIFQTATASARTIRMLRMWGRRSGPTQETILAAGRREAAATSGPAAGDRRDATGQRKDDEEVAGVRAALRPHAGNDPRGGATSGRDDVGLAG